MRKIILLIITIFLLTACNPFNSHSELENIGYSKDEINLIEEYDIEDIIKQYPYQDDLKELLNDPSFNKDKIKNYLDIKGLSAHDRLMIVNKGYEYSYYDEDILSLMKERFYIHSRLDRYLKMLEEGYDYRDAIERVNANRDLTFYEDSFESDLSVDNLIIANKYYTLGEFVPSNLVQIDSQYGIDGYLQDEAYEAYKQMANDAKSNGLSLWITSPYRSYKSQYRIYNRYLENDPVEVVDTYSARPGYSDHQTGLTVDIVSPGYDFDNFEDSNEFEWLQENAYKYGFILRYPKDKTDITGYMYESWHYRYVGVDVATYIFNNNITFDEYYAYFIEN